MKINRWPSIAPRVVPFLLMACSTPPGENTSRPSGGTGASTGNPSSGGAGGAGGGNTGGADNTGATGGGITPPPDRRDAAIDVGKDAPSCSAVEAENDVIVITTVTPIDLYFLVDKSGSMLTSDVPGTPTRWAALSTAIGSFADASAMDGGSAGIGVGMAFFPITTVGDAGALVSSCNLADYARAVVPVAPLPGNAAALKNGIAAIMPSGGTPTAPALQGAVQVATAYQMAHIDRKVAIVLATDGEPNDCSSTASGVAAIASAAFMQTPRLLTYVLGIGPSTGPLDSIASAGGTTKAFMVTASGADQLLQALNQIRVQTQVQTGTKISCSQKIPPSTGTQMLDYGAAVVTTTIGTMTLRPPKVADAAACGTSDGWYYDDPMKPTIITFCPVTCSALSPDSGKSRVAISIPCVPPPIEPPHEPHPLW